MVYVGPLFETWPDLLHAFSTLKSWLLLRPLHVPSITSLSSLAYYGFLLPITPSGTSPASV